MKTKSNTIGSFEAKTHLSRILNDVEDGAEITITKRGKPIARLIPYKDKNLKVNRREILFKFEEIRNSIKGHVNIKDYINEGRKY